VRALVVVVLLIAVLLVGAVAFLSSQASVDLAMRELISRSDGRLDVEGATGSMLDTVRVRRLVWRGPGADVTATDVALTWSPAALWSRRLVIHGFATQLLTFDLKPSDTPTQLPVTLTLPMEVTIERVGVAQLDWHVGKNRGTIRGLEFTYAGGAIEHRVTKLALVADVGTVSGDAMIGANAPYPIGGNLQFKGAAELKEVEGALRMSGTLAELAIDGSGRAADARVEVHAALAPLGAVLLREIALDATDVDIATWKSSLPKTRVALNVHAQPVDGGLKGTLEATNALAGSLDAGRVPVRAFSAHFAWRADALAFEQIAAVFHGGGRATGEAQIPLATAHAAGKWALDVHDVDLKGMYASLNTTKLRGRISADLNTDKPRISGDIADRDIVGGLALAFAAVVADGRIDVERFRARAGLGELEGRGRIALTGDRAFRLDATANHFDPARLGKYPAGNLVGTIAATGVLAPAWRVDASVAIASGSRLAGVALSGTARGSVARDSIRDAAIDLQMGSAKLAATGSTGRADDRILVTLDAPRVAELAPFFPRKRVRWPVRCMRRPSCAACCRTPASMRKSRAKD
jgi:translocation and assembly module TamB